MAPLSLIGYWRAEGDTTSEYPDPCDWVDTNWDEEERDATWFYFATGTLFRTFMGSSPCRICGKPNGAVEYTDGTYVWPEGLAHYIYDHAVRMPEDLVRHAREQLDRLEERRVAADWWISTTAKEQDGTSDFAAPRLRSELEVQAKRVVELGHQVGG